MLEGTIAEDKRLVLEMWGGTPQSSARGLHSAHRTNNADLTDSNNRLVAKLLLQPFALCFCA